MSFWYISTWLKAKSSMIVSIVNISNHRLYLCSRHCFIYIPELKIRGSFQDNSKIIFLIFNIFFNENIVCDHSLEPSCQNGSKEGVQHMF